MAITFPGEDVVPGPPAFDCPVCHPGGTSPEFIYVCLSGILRGDNWVVADGPPPNGIWKCTPIAACSYEAIDPPWEIWYRPSPFRTLFRIRRDGGAPDFSSFAAPTCHSWADNNFQVPAGRVFYGGWAAAALIEDIEQFSLHKLVDYVSVPPVAGSYVTPRPLAGEIAWNTVYRRDLSAHVKILFDLS